MYGPYGIDLVSDRLMIIRNYAAELPPRQSRDDSITGGQFVGTENQFPVQFPSRDAVATGQHGQRAQRFDSAGNGGELLASEFQPAANRALGMLIELIQPPRTVVDQRLRI